MLTREDIHELGVDAVEAAEPLERAAELIDAVDRVELAEVDAGLALTYAAQITEAGGDFAGAETLADRAVDAARPHGDDQLGPARAFRAGLLLRLGRETEGMAELVELRPLLSRDPEAAYYVADALEASDRAEVAVRWLTAALEPMTQPPGPADDRAAAVLLELATHRHDLRRELDLPHDDLDDLADDLAGAAGDHEGGTAVPFWPLVEFEQLVEQWPELVAEYGRDWDEHRAHVERELQRLADTGVGPLELLPGSVTELAEFGDPTDLEVLDDYFDELAADPGDLAAWPPGRNEPCWCGSGAKYKKCCRRR